MIEIIWGVIALILLVVVLWAALGGVFRKRGPNSTRTVKVRITADVSGFIRAMEQAAEATAQLGQAFAATSAAFDEFQERMRTPELSSTEREIVARFGLLEPDEREGGNE